MNTRLLILAQGAFILMTLACNKEEDPSDCSNPGSLKITVSDNPVISGTGFRLKLNQVYTASFYYWTGPNGWESNEEEPYIPHALSSHAGKYKVRELNPWGCEIFATSDSVIVTQPAPPCNPGNNTAVFASAGISDMYFYNVTGGTSGGSYFINANSTTGSLKFEFAGTGKPVAGVYNVRPLGPDWLLGDVRVNLFASSSNWPASSGKVYVTTDNDKVRAIFCDLPVYAQTWGFSTTASGNVIEQ